MQPVTEKLDTCMTPWTPVFGNADASLESAPTHQVEAACTGGLKLTPIESARITNTAAIEIADFNNTLSPFPGF